MDRERFSLASLQEVRRGYVDGPGRGEMTCLFCGEVFQNGHIYKGGADLLDAQTAMTRHIEDTHNSVFSALLGLGKEHTGLSDNQAEMLSLFSLGLSDKEIQARVGDLSLSTIRNYRFVFREKKRQAYTFIALMQALEDTMEQSQTERISIPGRPDPRDARFLITREEYEQIIRKLFPEGADGSLIRFPKKDKQKVAVMIHLLRRFSPDTVYSESEVNALLAAAHPDYVTIRRYMVDYGFLSRTADGREYRVTTG